MVTYRIDRLNKEFLRLISGMLQTRIKNSDAGEAILTMVSVSRDLGHAKVFYTLINQEDREKVQTALDSAAPVLRAMLGKELRLRTIPELHFCFDESEVKARRMDELLDTLASNGYTLCVATSKPRVFAERILDHFGIARYFSFVGGTGLDGSLPTKADVIAHVLAGSNITDRGTALMIGDRKYDILGAKTIGIDSAGVLYGYGDRAELEAAGADYILPAIPDLEELLLE